MTFKEHLKLHGVGEEFLNPEGTLARIDVDQEGVSVFLPIQEEKRVSGLKVPISHVIFAGLSVKFTENFKTETYVDAFSSLGLDFPPLGLDFSSLGVDLPFEGFDPTKWVDPKAPVFNGYIERNTRSKDNSQFPFGTFLKVQVVGAQWAQYEEPDGTVWQISHIPLAYFCWVEVLD